MKPIVFLSLILFSCWSWAARVIITGEPILLEQRGNLYYPPATYQPPANTSYTYVTIGGIPRVCYLNPQPALAGLDVVTINVEVQGTRTPWSCYKYNTTYFEARP